MNFDLLFLLMAAGGGFFAAAIGALHAFIFTGFMVLLGNAVIMAGGGPAFLNDVAFGPVFGPHIAFAGGVAAAAYAARVSDKVGGKDIGVPLISIERIDVLLVGAGFGMLGYLINLGVTKIPWFGTHTDTVAFTVVVSAIIVRLAIGRGSLFGNIDQQAAGWGRFAPKDSAAWVRYHEKFVPNSFLGFFVGLLSSGLAMLLARAYPDLAIATVFFGISAVSLFFLSLGLSFPVTHHITLIAAVATVNFLPIVGNEIGTLFIGAIAGMVAAWFAEFFARFLHDHGNTHIDPPAAAIWPATTIVLALAGVLA
ncbi:hypothetical protein FDO65_01360 [Nakamurella flava]|jgi:hypothetical protein|uniref:DUF7973 domain-containing protein n=1 Tax=Nakamurella flava TaxID=2576308 RepID=A0A4V6CS62_9ACTN|nr:hypothetical protein [Nakamurella flava]TKV60395.1 hypothetical protein FDO65_01360 [Nakamurella flava]